MKIRFLALAGLLALAPAITWGGSVYKWVDENGVVHYGDKQPGGQKSEKMRVRTSTGSKSRAESSSAAPQAQEDAASKNGSNANKQADKGDGQQLSEDEKRQNEEACQRAKDNLKVIEENSRIQMNIDGERRYLTPEEIEKQKERAQDIIDQAC